MPNSERPSPPVPSDHPEQTEAPQNVGRGTCYVAAAAHDIGRARTWMSKLREVGWTIALDWTLDVEEQAARGGDASLSEDEARRAAENDRRGVLTSDYLWVLFPDDGGAGVHTELGIALGVNKLAQSIGVDPIIVMVSGASSRNVFTSLADHRFATDEEAFGHLTAY